MSDSVYERLGGRPGVARLVERFYDLMETLPEAAGIRAMHPADLGTSRERLTLFLTMWTGGPADYVQQRGHPRLRARHLPFPIGDAEAAAWMRCMQQALSEEVDDARLREELVAAFGRVALHMRNRAP